MRLALERGVISRYEEVLDFGSGKGFDVSHLAQMGIPCTGFDPYYNYCPQVVRPYPVVACNYVLNVIESDSERAEVLRYIWSLTERSLIVAIRTSPKKSKGEVFGGQWTSIGTYQYFYTQTEWIAYVATILGVVRVQYPAPGIAFIHRK